MGLLISAISTGFEAVCVLINAISSVTGFTLEAVRLLINAISSVTGFTLEAVRLLISTFSSVIKPVWTATTIAAPFILEISKAIISVGLVLTKLLLSCSYWLTKVLPWLGSGVIWCIILSIVVLFIVLLRQLSTAVPKAFSKLLRPVTTIPTTAALLYVGWAYDDIVANNQLADACRGVAVVWVAMAFAVPYVFSELTSQGRGNGGLPPQPQPPNRGRQPRLEPIPKPAKVFKAEDCSICREEFAASSQIITTTACGHQFHEDCLAKWRQSRKSNILTCPNCRAPISLVGRAVQELFT